MADDYPTFDGMEAELLAEGYTHGYSTPWLATGIDEEVCASSTCERCGHHGMEYHAFSRPEDDRRSSYRAVAACPRCRYAAEF